MIGALERAPRLLEERLGVLESRVRSGDETAWSEYLQVIHALTAALGYAAPGSGRRLISTRELGELMGLSPKTLLRKKAKGQIQGAVQLGRRGRGAVRWNIAAAFKRP